MQAKLFVGPAGDKYEQEADRVAQQVTNAPGPAAGAGSVQRQQPVEEEVRAKPLSASISPLVQRNAPTEQKEDEEEEKKKDLQTKRSPQGNGRDGFETGAGFEGRLRSAQGGGSPLPAPVRGEMEPKFGADFSGVRLHTGGEAATLNRMVSAQAFTHGRDIYLGQGSANLHSSAGKRLLAHELTHTIQQGAVARTAAPAASAPPVQTSRLPAIQRRIGFEIETGIPVMKEVTANTDYDPLNNDELESAVPGGKLMVDHLPGHADDGIEQFDEWNILEFVTDPLNDRLGDTAFRNTVRPWLVNLLAIKTYAQGHFSPFANAPHVGAPHFPQTVIGLRPGRAGAATYRFWDRVAPQATMGIKLKKIGEVFGQAQAGGFGGHVRHDRVSEGAHRAEPAANRIMTTLLHDYSPTWGRGKGVNSLRGLLTLLCNYLLTGLATWGKGGYLKNMSLFMYKSKLSSVRNQIVNEYYGEKILARYPARRKRVRRMLIQETGRAADEEVFEGAARAGNPVLVKPWLDEVLTGTDDSMFEGMKNPWSNEIAPEDIHSKKGAVMEMRDISAFGQAGLNLTLSNTNGLLDYLLAVYKINKAWAK